MGQPGPGSHRGHIRVSGPFRFPGRETVFRSGRLSALFRPGTLGHGRAPPRSQGTDRRRPRGEGPGRGGLESRSGPPPGGFHGAESSPMDPQEGSPGRHSAHGSDHPSTRLLLQVETLGPGASRGKPRKRSRLKGRATSLEIDQFPFSVPGSHSVVHIAMVQIGPGNPNGGVEDHIIGAKETRV